MERVIQITMHEREIKALLAVLAVWNGMVGAFKSQAVLDKFLEEAGRAQGWPPEQITMTKQGVRDAMKFSIPCTRRAETNGGKARGARA